MIKKLNVLVMATCLAFGATSCQQSGHRSESLVSTSGDGISLVAILDMDAEYGLSDSLILSFTVHNTSSDTLQFTQYHTPFEGFLNNIFTITDSLDQEEPYLGAMAKRVMPPVPESYRKVAPGGKDVVTIDLRKGYAMESTGSYTIRYNGGNVSGISDGEPIHILIK